MSLVLGKDTRVLRATLDQLDQAFPFWPEAEWAKARARTPTHIDVLPQVRIDQEHPSFHEILNLLGEGEAVPGFDDGSYILRRLVDSTKLCVAPPDGDGDLFLYASVDYD